MEKKKDLKDINPHGKHFSKREMIELFHITPCILTDSTFMYDHEKWCYKTGSGKKCKWMFKYDEFMKHYDNIVARR